MIVNQRVELERLKCKVCLMIDELKNCTLWNELFFLSREITMWWSMTMRKQSLSLAILRSLFSKKVNCFNFNNCMKIMAFSKLIVMVITNVLTLLLCSVRWGWDEDWSSTESLVGETAANSVYASRPKKIHQVSLQFCDPVQVWIFFFTRLLCQHPAESHDKSLHSLWFLWCLLVSSFTRTSTSSPHPLSFFFPSHFPQFTNHISVVWLSYFCFYFSLPLSFFSFFFSTSSICPFILVVSAYLLLWRPTCQDHRDQLSTTWQMATSFILVH